MLRLRLKHPVHSSTVLLPSHPRARSTKVKGQLIHSVRGRNPFPAQPLRDRLLCRHRVCMVYRNRDRTFSSSNMGGNSCDGQNVFDFSLVHVLCGSPFNPCTKTTSTLPPPVGAYTCDRPNRPISGIAEPPEVVYKKSSVPCEWKKTWAGNDSPSWPCLYAFRCATQKKDSIHIYSNRQIRHAGHRQPRRGARRAAMLPGAGDSFRRVFR